MPAFRNICARLCLLLINLAVISCKSSGTEEAKKGPDEEKMQSHVTLTGDYVCLPHRGVKPGDPTTAECAFGLLTDNGRYYAVDLSAVTFPAGFLHPGDRVRIPGTLAPVSRGDELYRYVADSLLNVTGPIEKL